MTPDPVDLPIPAPLPLVLTIDEVAKVIRMSRRGIERLRQHHQFPIREIRLPLDRRPRWLSEEVLHALRTGLVPAKGKPRKVSLHVVHDHKVGRRSA